MKRSAATPAFLPLALLTLSLGVGFGAFMLPAHAVAKPAGGGTIKVSADRQMFKPFDGTTSFTGGVRVAMEDTQIIGPNAQINMGGKSSDHAFFTNGPTLVRKSGSTQQTIKAGTLNMGLKSGDLEAKGGVTTQIAGDAKTGGNVSIASDSQVFDQQKHLMKVVGHVRVKQGDIDVTSPEALVFLGESGGAEKAIFVRGASLKRGEQQIKAQTITVKLDTGDVFAENKAESVVDSTDSTGKPTHIRVTSHLQELDKETGVLTANGNAVVYYDDYTAKGPKAVFLRKNDKMDHIVMSGRAQIEDPDRRVTGDRVIITIDPRQFTAQGNVTTFIKAKDSGSSNAAPATDAKTGKPGKADKSKKAGSTAKSAAAKAASAVSANQRAMDQEMMMEEARKGSSAGTATP